MQYSIQDTKCGNTVSQSENHFFLWPAILGPHATYSFLRDIHLNEMFFKILHNSAISRLETTQDITALWNEPTTTTWSYYLETIYSLSLS